MRTDQALQEARQLEDEIARDAPLILAHVLNRPLAWIYTWPEHELGKHQIARYRELLQRRRAGEPLAYLTGEKEFWSLPLKVTPATLIPRPETELLVELALEFGDSTAPVPRVLDLGTGSGAIALALAHERPGWRITATDVSREALAVAEENARRLGLQGVRFLAGHWFDALAAGERFHLIASNPPYVAEGDPHLLESGLPHEPGSALIAGPEGLDDLRRIISGAPCHLEPGGWLLVEHGADQGRAVRELFRKSGFHEVVTRKDLGGRDRVTLGCYSERQ